jgi:hypothetical protein
MFSLLERSFEIHAVRVAHATLFKELGIVPKRKRAVFGLRELCFYVWRHNTIHTILKCPMQNQNIE